MNDISVITGIVAFFVLMGVFLPYAHTVEGTDTDIEADASDVTGDIGETADSPTTPGIWKIVTSVLSMFFWTFGSLPFWIDSLFVILRITLALTVARNVWIGGGG